MQRRTHDQEGGWQQQGAEQMSHNSQQGGGAGYGQQQGGFGQGGQGGQMGGQMGGQTGGQMGGQMGGGGGQYGAQPPIDMNNPMVQMAATSGAQFFDTGAAALQVLSCTPLAVLSHRFQLIVLFLPSHNQQCHQEGVRNNASWL